ncbi:MAG: thyX [Gammaproteobacteria bacterium]|nr:thyX [Gammaproteobacteria bacterium]
MKINVLDHGYVELIEAWGHGKDGQYENDDLVHDYEAGIIEAARQSTQGNFRGWDQDAKLLKHLHDNKHATPFEFAGMVLEVQAPIFVFREWHRHRTQSYNEMSARYTPLPDLYYTPDPANLSERANAVVANRQAQGLKAGLQQDDAERWLSDLQLFYKRAEELYQFGLRQGVPKELARLVMPVGHYSRMRASANLRNWLAFLTLRMDSNAQWEIRQYANAVGQIVERYFPQTWKLFNHD